MKIKILSLILSIVMLIIVSSCGKNNGNLSESGNDSSEISKASDWNPDVPEREKCSDEGSMCGVYYMDYTYDDFSGMKKKRKYYNQIFKSTGSIKKFPFLKDIPNENIVSTPMGTEIYLIIPSDAEAHVEVYLVEMDYESYTMKREEEPVYASDRGVPFVLQCNYGDLFSDAEIVITDSNGEILTWSPSISLKDGTVNTKNDDGKKITDFTEYKSDYEVMDD